MSIALWHSTGLCERAGADAIVTAEQKVAELKAQIEANRGSRRRSHSIDRPPRRIRTHIDSHRAKCVRILFRYFIEIESIHPTSSPTVGKAL